MNNQLEKQWEKQSEKRWKIPYEYYMLEANRLAYMVPVRCDEGVSFLTEGMHSLSDYLKEGTYTYYLNQKLMAALVYTCREFGEYMLDENALVLNPKQIYMNDTSEFRFVYDADVNGDSKYRKLSDLTEFLLDKLDYEDEDLISYIYELDRLTHIGKESENSEEVETMLSEFAMKEVKAFSTKQNKCSPNTDDIQNDFSIPEIKKEAVNADDEGNLYRDADYMKNCPAGEKTGLILSLKNHLKKIFSKSKDSPPLKEAKNQLIAKSSTERTTVREKQENNKLCDSKKDPESRNRPDVSVCRYETDMRKRNRAGAERKLLHQIADEEKFIEEEKFTEEKEVIDVIEETGGSGSCQRAFLTAQNPNIDHDIYIKEACLIGAIGTNDSLARAYVNFYTENGLWCIFSVSDRMVKLDDEALVPSREYILYNHSKLSINGHVFLFRKLDDIIVTEAKA